MQSESAPVRFAILAADTALFTLRDNELLVRLIRINRPPHFIHREGLPGGLVHPTETADVAAIRHVGDKAHVDPHKIYMEQLYTFSAIDRDPRGRVVAVAYLALATWESLSETERAGVAETYWKPVRSVRFQELAYDHKHILETALARLRSRITYTTLIQKLMANEFTLSELERAYESILHTDLDKRNFRKKIKKLRFLKELPRKRAGGKFRPAQLYGFKSGEVHELDVL